jgi:hypothetical protein
MVRKEKKNGRTLFLCESCGFFYENEEEVAAKCEVWCETYTRP